MGSLGPNSGQGFSSPYSPQQSRLTSGKSVENTQINPDQQGGSESPMPSASTQALGSVSQGQIPYDALFRTDLNMNAAQVARLLKNLLHLPSEILDLLAFLSQLEPANSSEILQKLSQEQVNVSLDELQAFLLDRLASSQGKLMKLIQNNGGESGSALSKLLVLREELAEQGGKSGMEAVKTLITLYLPSLPLRELQEFGLRFLTPKTPLEKQLEGDQKEEEGNYKLSGGEGEQAEDAARWLITVKTYSYGEFRIVLIINTDRGKAQTLTAQIGHDEEARPIVPEIKKRLTLAMESDKLPEPLLTFVAKQASNSNKISKARKIYELAQESAQAAHVQAVNAPASVPAIGIHWAYRIIRLILDLDNQALSENQNLK